MLFFINTFKPPFIIDIAANILRIEFEKVVKKIKKLLLINIFKPTYNIEMLQKKCALNFENYIVKR